MKEQIRVKYLQSKTAYSKYMVRMALLDKYIEEFESDTERLLGPYAENWETLIQQCKSFKELYSPLKSIYNGPESKFNFIPEAIINGTKEYDEAFILGIAEHLDEYSLQYLEIEKDLSERLDKITQLRKLLIENG